MKLILHVEVILGGKEMSTGKCCRWHRILGWADHSTLDHWGLGSIYSSPAHEVIHHQMDPRKYFNYRLNSCWMMVE
ncbi:hypothetical protein Y1Q_0006141 [Alligator mississippiensis]|uniref:Uncharacterized protein n=1 Tax=Alligator mississippiensis TaxID=8496 RepID=A0A151NWN0_ALLMI|nr:hypothetical protein Y1Q_0006141 [Alligator mississippiensis]